MRYRLLLFMVAPTLAAAFACTPAPPPPAADAPAASAPLPAAEAEQAIRQLESDRITALTGKDLAFVERVYADNYVVTGANGVIRDRAQIVDDMRTGVQTFESLTNDNVQVRVYGDTGIVSGQTTTKGMYKGQPSLSPTNFTRVYVRQDGRWRLVSNHASAVAP